MILDSGRLLTVDHPPRIARHGTIGHEKGPPSMRWLKEAACWTAKALSAIPVASVAVDVAVEPGAQERRGKKKSIIEIEAGVFEAQKIPARLLHDTSAAAQVPSFLAAARRTARTVVSGVTLHCFTVSSISLVASMTRSVMPVGLPPNSPAI